MVKASCSILPSRLHTRTCWCYCLMMALMSIAGPNIFVSSWSLPKQVKNVKPTFLPTSNANTYSALSMVEHPIGPEDAEEEAPPDFPSFDSYEEELSPTDLQSLTVTQLKQQLRLRGLKVSGNKSELVGRLLAVRTNDADGSKQKEQYSGTSSAAGASTSTTGATPKDSKARRVAKEHGKELVDVTEFLEEKDKGKAFKSSDDPNDETQDGNSESDPETWGIDAKIVDDYEGRRPVVDSMSQTVVEFKGSNRTQVEAYVVASRDALKPFLAGGIKSNATRTPPEERLRQIQMQREQANKEPLREEDNIGLDEGDEDGKYKDILHRDFSDWGKHTVTGAQLSAQEVQGILLLTDVYGPFSDDTKELADKIAFECQPVVVMVPDLFRGNPWKEKKIDGRATGLNEKGETYEVWRASHSDVRVSVDIRAAAAVLRESYGVSSVVVWGTGYGGGSALEQASGVFPGENIHDIDGSIGPPPVDPMAAIAWYPTRYNARELFGAMHKGTLVDSKFEKRAVAVMAVFAGKDTIPGATSEDADLLKSLLEDDDRVKDHLVKVFPGRDHGFAHIGLAQRNEEDNDFARFVDDEFGGSGQITMHEGDAEVACLLSTAFMETYSRVFLPTIGVPIREDKAASEWNELLEMKNIPKENSRDVRQEIDEALNNFVEPPSGGLMIDPRDESQHEALARHLQSFQSDDVPEEYRVELDDDIDLMFAKMKAWDENFQLL